MHAWVSELHGSLCCRCCCRFCSCCCAWRRAMRTLHTLELGRSCCCAGHAMCSSQAVEAAGKLLACRRRCPHRARRPAVPAALAGPLPPGDGWMLRRWTDWLLCSSQATQCLKALQLAPSMHSTTPQLWRPPPLLPAGRLLILLPSSPPPPQYRDQDFHIAGESYAGHVRQLGGAEEGWSRREGGRVEQEGGRVEQEGGREGGRRDTAACKWERIETVPCS